MVKVKKVTDSLILTLLNASIGKKFWNSGSGKMTKCMVKVRKVSDLFILIMFNASMASSSGMMGAHMKESEKMAISIFKVRKVIY